MRCSQNTLVNPNVNQLTNIAELMFRIELNIGMALETINVTNQKSVTMAIQSVHVKAL